MQALNINKLELDHDTLIEICNGVHSMFSVTFGLTPVAQPHRLERGCTVQGDLSGVVTMVQERIEATMIVSFQKEVVFTMLAKAYNIHADSVDNLVISTVGEIANVVHGVVKTNLNRRGFALQPSIPSVVVGQSHIIGSPTATSLVIPFLIEHGKFHVVLTLNPDHLVTVR